MKNELDKAQRLLEEATAAGDAPADQLDPQIAPLREAWLAFGQLLEAAQPAGTVPIFVSAKMGLSPLPPARARRWRLSVAGLLAASLLIGIVTAWMLHDTNRQEGATPVPAQTVSTHRQVTTPAPAANGPQWDDSLDDQLARVGQRMIYGQEDQFPGADAFGLAQYAVEQVGQEVQADKL